MVVKSKVGRRRYIVFRIHSNRTITKGDLITYLRYALEQNLFSIDNQSLSSNKSLNKFNRMPWVIFIRNNIGIIRCHHLDTKNTIALLNSFNSILSDKQLFKITTLGTTGTIKSARKKYLDKLFLYPLNINYLK